MKTRLAMVTLTALLGALAATYTVRAAPRAIQPTSDPISALLVEVHGLRIAMEQSAAVTPRVQLTLARLNIEEQRIGQLTAQLDATRRELAAAITESQKIADAHTEVVQRLQTITDDKERRALEYESEDLKRRQKAMSGLEQQARAREEESSQALSIEQSRWIDLNSRLDELERLLTPVPR